MRERRLDLYRSPDASSIYLLADYLKSSRKSKNSSANSSLQDCANISVPCASPGKDRIRLGSVDRSYILVINPGIVLERSFSAKRKSLGIVSAAIFSTVKSVGDNGLI